MKERVGTKMKYAIVFILVIILVTLVFTGCAKIVKSGIILPKDALDMIQNDKYLILLDVRTPEEYKEKRIPGSTLLPDYEVEVKALDVIPDKETKVIVYCRSGRRSAGAVKVLNKLGYQNVYDLGGISNWPCDTVSGD